MAGSLAGLRGVAGKTHNKNLLILCAALLHLLLRFHCRWRAAKLTDSDQSIIAGIEMNLAEINIRDMECRLYLKNAGRARDNNSGILKSVEEFLQPHA